MDLYIHSPIPPYAFFEHRDLSFSAACLLLLQKEPLRITTDSVLSTLILISRERMERHITTLNL
jgi:hypothetical protein